MAGVFQAKDGKVAIWTGTQNDAPFMNPLGNISRVKFHSDLDYVRVTSLRSYTLTIPAIPASGSGQSDPGVRAKSYTLGAHGQRRTPFCIGKIVVQGIPLAFTGSVLVHNTQSTQQPDMFGRFLALGADAVNLYVHEYAVQNGNANTGVWTPRPAQSFAIEVGITDISL